MLKNTQKDKNPNSIDLSDKVRATYLRLGTLDKDPERFCFYIYTGVLFKQVCNITLLNMIFIRTYNLRFGKINFIQIYLKC